MEAGVNLSQYRIVRRIGAGGIERRTRGVEALPGGVEAHRVAHAHGVQLGDDHPQRLHRPQAARHAAVGDETDRLAAQRATGEIEGVLQRAGEAVVVLRGHDHQRVGRLQPSPPDRHVGPVREEQARIPDP